jgi:mannan endo-1,4-beta-mannosidase
VLVPFKQLGPALWGMTAYVNLSKASDWPSISFGQPYQWFADCYLHRMRQASEQADARLQDVLDVHWYTEDPKGRAWTGTEAILAAAAMHDPSHTEDNWVGQHFARYLPLLPRLRESVDRFYPGMRLAVSEYDWPMTGTIYGGLAQADTLGAFGKANVYFVAYHQRFPDKPDDYVGVAFAIYRDYDGQQSTFVDESLPIQIAEGAPLVAYAEKHSQTGQLHVVIVHRAIESATNIVLKADGGSLSLASSWFLDDREARVRRGPMPGVNDAGQVVLELPPLSAWHVVMDVLPAP